MLSYPVHATPASAGNTVKGLYEVLLTTIKNGRILGQSGRFTQLDPVIRRSFDVASTARLSVGPILGRSERGTPAADDRELRALHLGDLCRPLRQLKPNVGLWH
jgi:hypothetical protein